MKATNAAQNNIAKRPEVSHVDSPRKSPGKAGGEEDEDVLDQEYAAWLRALKGFSVAQSESTF